MTNQTWIKLLAPAFIATLVLTGCPSDDDGTDEVGDTGTDTTGDTGDTTTTTTTTDDATTTVDDTTETTGDTTDTTTGELPDPFVFADNPAEDYMRVDRKGMPAIATAVITSKDAYNAANPVDDAALTFVDEITANVGALHVALNDDLMGANLTPCIVVNCVNQAAPLVVPDTLKINLDAPAGFPNGRALTDPVIDVTLAVILLELTAPEDALILAGIPLNPAANDVAFELEFPYLAVPH